MCCMTRFVDGNKIDSVLELIEKNTQIRKAKFVSRDKIVSKVKEILKEMLGIQYMK